MQQLLKYHILCSVYNVDWKLCSWILRTCELSLKHTGEHIRIAVQEILEEFGVWRPGNTYVTDNAANMKLAIKDLSWLGCSGHNLNLALSHVLKDVRDPDQQGDISKVLQQISVCKGIVGHVKWTRIQAMLDTTLKQRGLSTITEHLLLCVLVYTFPLHFVIQIWK